MFKECLDVFSEMLKHEDNLILKSYVPADGSYVIVKKRWNCEKCGYKD